MLLGQAPILEQLLLVHTIPFHDRAECPSREAPLNNARVDLHADLVLAVLRVEVGRLVIIVEHVDDDAKEATDFGHECVLLVLSNGPADELRPRGPSLR